MVGKQCSTDSAVNKEKASERSGEEKLRDQDNDN